MNKNNYFRIGILLGILFIISFVFGIIVSAECVENNDFTVGDDINICAYGCQYRNQSNLSQILPCDNSVNCKITSFYPNGTLISAYNDMSVNQTVVNYSYGNSTLNTTGIYTSKIDCFRDIGWTHVSFKWSISDAEQVFETIGRHNPTIDSFVSSVVNDGKEKFFNTRLKTTLSILGILIILILILRFKKFRFNKLKKKLEDEIKN